MNTVCPFCLAIYPVADECTGECATCGHCGCALFDGKPVHATSSTLDTLLADDLPVIVDFWAPWCRPCVNFAPVFEEVAKERNGKIRFVKVNTEADPELSARFRVRSIPTIMIFKKGEVIDILGGAMPKVPFDGWIDENL
ncbi:thioredoxin TrxC [Shimwellia pseudoproteus]|uniref:thioredoxin TrxC n=1 Tax=Shimwellia pseudoproteus TaxID=570012 RepID=UPI0018ED5631|nr:thioredoxin TrxC [Shimwellia pseudoproteus]MBJ3817020.1 thioredoxin TrxC [Shimwellia pseudoproteus]